MAFPAPSFDIHLINALDLKLWRGGGQLKYTGMNLDYAGINETQPLSSKNTVLV